MKKIYLFLSLTSLLISCEKSDPVECYLIYKPIINSNSPVIAGNDIILSSNSTGNSNGGVYVWTGPNGFTSNEPNPIISNASTAMIGEYKFKYKRGICETNEVSTNIDVVVNNTVTCTPNDNTGTFSNQFYPFSYYSISTTFLSDEFRFSAGNGNSSIRFFFSGSTLPKSGIYSIVENFGTNSQNQVKVNTTIGYQYNNPQDYFAKSGDVLVSFTNSGEIYAVFCNVPFYSGTFTNSSFTGTVKIIED